MMVNALGNIRVNCSLAFNADVATVSKIIAINKNINGFHKY